MRRRLRLAGALQRHDIGIFGRLLDSIRLAID
jgi:hypothetical protein